MILDQDASENLNLTIQELPAVFMDLPRRIADLEQKVEKVLTLCERMEPDSKPELPKSMQLFQIRNKLGTY